MREAAVFSCPSVAIESPLGLLRLGIADPTAPGVSIAISRLLFRSIGDARASRGGHLPEWLVDDVERNYISPEKVATLWAEKGHRFVVVLGEEIVATAHVTKRHDTIFTIDRVLSNVSAKEHPGFKPDGFHHLVNLSVKHELRRARIAMRMIDGIASSFRDRFDGVGLWVRGDPPWHTGLAGLGFDHDPSMDIFLPAEAETTAGIPHAELNRRYACECVASAPQKPERIAARERDMEDKKLQYVSFTRRFDAPPLLSSRPAPVRSATERRSSTSISIAPSLDRVVVGAGATLRSLVRALAPHGVLPPVVSGFLPATVGGVLATGGVGKGSHRAGLAVDHVLAMTVTTSDGRSVACDRVHARWLFDATLGGMGTTGTILDATIPLAPAPSHVVVEKRELGSVDALLDALDAASADPATYHVTSWRSDNGWGLARAAVAARDAANAMTIASYIDRDVEVPNDPSWLHAFFARDAARTWLERLASVAFDQLQVVPVRRPASAAMTYAVLTTRARAAAGDAARLRDEALALGGVLYLDGQPGQARQSRSSSAISK